MLLTSGQPLDLGHILPLEGWNVLDVPILGQEQTMWCWAAVSMTLALYFNRTAAPFTSQAALASAFVGQGADCTRTVSGPDGKPIMDPAVAQACNVGFDIDPVLSSLFGAGNCTGRWEADQQTQIDEIRDQISAKLPVPCEFLVGSNQPDFPRGGLHYFLISGHRSSPGSEEVRVIDPLYHGCADVTLNALRTTLSGRTGTWVRTYYLKRRA
jgi:hypothetical protein